VNARSRYILRFRGAADPPANDEQRVRAREGITVLEAHSPRLLLVEGSEDDLRNIAADLSGWTLEPEARMRFFGE
jgi:hypothetical protein